MPLSLSYFNLRSLNTSKELSRLVDTGVHMRGGRGNPPGLSRYQQRTLMLSPFALPAPEQLLVCLPSSSATLSLSSPDGL